MNITQKVSCQGQYLEGLGSYWHFRTLVQVGGFWVPDTCWNLVILLQSSVFTPKLGTATLLAKL